MTPREEEAGVGDAWTTPRGEMLPVRETAGDEEAPLPDLASEEPSEGGTLYDSTPEPSEAGTLYDSTPEPSASSSDDSVYAEEEEPTRGRGGTVEYSDSFCSTPSLSSTPVASPRFGELVSALSPLPAPGSGTDGPPTMSPRYSAEWSPASPQELGSPEGVSLADVERYSSDSFCTAPSDAGSPLSTPVELSPRYSPAASPLGSTPQQSLAGVPPWWSPSPSRGGVGGAGRDIHGKPPTGDARGPGVPPGSTTSPANQGGGRNLSGDAPTRAPFPSPPRREPGRLTLEGIRSAKARFLRGQDAVSPAVPDYAPLIALLRACSPAGVLPQRDEEERVYPSALVDRMRIYNLLHRMRQACSEIDELEARQLPQGVREVLFCRHKLRVLAGKEATQHLRAAGVI